MPLIYKIKKMQTKLIFTYKKNANTEMQSP